VAAVVLVVTACSGGGAGGGDRAPGPRGAEPTAVEQPAPPPGPAEQLGLREGWGPTVEELDRAARQVGRLRLPQLAGQVIVADWAGTAAPVPMVRDLHLGGVIAFSNNVVDARQVRAVNRALVRGAKRKWPLFLSVDQEGGVVERLQGAATRFPAFMSAGAAGDTDLTRRVYGAAAAELRDLGFTADFAPDADVTSGPGDPTIGSRSASSRPAEVSAQARAAAAGFADAGVVPVLKHFPGHGSVPTDSHLTLPVQRKSLAQLEKSDLVPFRDAAAGGAAAVMVGHIDLRAVDPGVPSSLSRQVVTGLLREELGHQGLVVTDSLKMTGVTRGRSADRIAVQAIRAGADVLLMPSSPARARAALVRAVRAGTLSRRRLEQAAARQVALLRHLVANAEPAGEASAAARDASRQLSQRAVTVVAGPCSGRLVDAAVHPYGDPGSVSVFAGAARAAGLEVLLRRATPTRLAAAADRPVRRKGERKRAFRKRLRAWRKDERRRELRLEQWTAAEDARLARGTAIGFSGYRDAPVDAQVLVATDSPWVLGRSTARSRIATYGSTPGAMQVLVEVLLGDELAPGRLPVTVDGVERRGC
jgi:beta-N-acetylhexosaminidase